MSFSRAFRRWVARGMVGILLFAQLAIAGYVCPGLGASAGITMPMDVASVAFHASGMQTPSDSQGGDSASKMAPCDQMAGIRDVASPNLCAEHCHAGQQSNQVHAVEAPAVALVSLYFVAPTNPEPLFLPRSAVARTADTRVTVSPPHAILHCVFRI